MTRTCAVCRTTLDEYPVTCGHGEVFCGGCFMEDGCDECRLDVLRNRADAAWEAAAQPGPWIDPVRDSAADTAAENQADQRAYELAHLEDREGII